MTASGRFLSVLTSGTARNVRIFSVLSRLFLRLRASVNYGGLMKDRSHDEAMVELFQADPSYAAELLAEGVQDGSTDELSTLERQLSVAFAAREVNSTS